MTGYEEALRRAAALREKEGADINPDCRTLLLEHGGRAARSVVLLHGLTNCPRQFGELAGMLHGLGCNVLVPATPTTGSPTGWRGTRPGCVPPSCWRSWMSRWPSAASWAAT